MNTMKNICSQTQLGLLPDHWLLCWHVTLFSPTSSKADWQEKVNMSPCRKRSPLRRPNAGTPGSPQPPRSISATHQNTRRRVSTLIINFTCDTGDIWINTVALRSNDVHSFVFRYLSGASCSHIPEPRATLLSKGNVFGLVYAPRRDSFGAGGYRPFFMWAVNGSTLCMANTQASVSLSSQLGSRESQWERRGPPSFFFFFTQQLLSLEGSCHHSWSGYQQVSKWWELINPIVKVSSNTDGAVWMKQKR